MTSNATAPWCPCGETHYQTERGRLHESDLSATERTAVGLPALAAEPTLTPSEAPSDG